MIYSVLDQAYVALISSFFDSNTNFWMKFSIQILHTFWSFLLYQWWLAYFEIFSKDLKASLCQGFTGEPARGCFKVSSLVQCGRRIYFAHQDTYQGLSKDLEACFENLNTKIHQLSSLLIFAVIPVQKNFFHLVGCDYWNAPGMGVKPHGDDFLIFLAVG